MKSGSWSVTKTTITHPKSLILRVLRKQKVNEKLKK